MSEFDPITNPHGYAHNFRTVTAPEYAREAVSYGAVQDNEMAADWAHETADSMAAVIYYGQSLALYAAGVFDDTDDSLAEAALADVSVGSADARILRAVSALSYSWHQGILWDAILAAQDEAAADPLSAGVCLA